MTRASRGIVAVLLTLIAIATAQAADDVFAHPTDSKTLLATVLATPASALQSAQVLKGSFTHRKHLSELPQPLVARGEFRFVRDLGVYWHTVKPFDSVFILTDDGIVQRDEQTETLRLSAEEQPAVRIIANIFLALFTLDVANLDKSFSLFGQAHSDSARSDRWTVGLRPKSAAIANVFEEAIVIGAKEVEEVVLVDRHGDRTEIELHDMQYSTAAPSAELRALFKY